MPLTRIERHRICMASPLPLAGPPLTVEPYILHSVAVVDAVDHCHETLDVGLRTGAVARVEDNRSGALLGQYVLDFPDDLLTLLDIGLGRLLVHQPVDLRVAVSG